PSCLHRQTAQESKSQCGDTLTGLVLDPIAKLIRVQMGAGLPQGLGEVVNDKATRIVQIRKAARAVKLWVGTLVVARAPVAALAGHMRGRFRHTHGPQLSDGLRAGEGHTGSGHYSSPS